MRREISSAVEVAGDVGYEWDGFYAPSYRCLVEATKKGYSVDSALETACAMHRRNPPGEGHWEFLAVAYLHLKYIRGNDELKADKSLECLYRLFKKRPLTANWRLMQRITQASLSGCRLSGRDFWDLGISPDADGCLPDRQGEQSSQYHAYMLLLGLRFGDESDNDLRTFFKRAFEWLYLLDSRYGDPSPVGRGRFQVFGYASMASAAYYARRWGFSIDGQWYQRVLQRLAPEQPNGALCQRWSGPHRDYLLYGYNTPADYSMFADLWLLETELRQQEEVPGTERWCWHTIGKNGEGILSDRTGPRFSTTLGSCGSNEQRTISKLRHWAWARFRQTKIEGSPPRVLGDGELMQLDASVSLVMNDGVLWVSINPRSLYFQSPILWVPDGTDTDFHVEGSVEEQSVRWSRSPGSAWSGRSFRIVRKGKVDCWLSLR